MFLDFKVTERYNCSIVAKILSIINLAIIRQAVTVHVLVYTTKMCLDFSLLTCFDYKS